MRIAFYAPRASHLTPGESGDKVYVRTLLAGLRGRGYDVKLVSDLNVRKFWRRRVRPWRLITEALTIRKEMKRFSPDVWLVFGASVKNPDLFGWWQRPGRYVLMNSYVGKGTGLPRLWRWLFVLAHRRSLRKADRIAAWRQKDADHLRSFGVERERVCVLPPAAKTWESTPSREDARQRLDLPQDAVVILCVSRLLEPRYDGKPWKTEWVLQLLPRMEQLPPDVILLLVGDGPGRKQVEEEIGRLKLDGRIRLAGSVAHDEIVWFYAACHFYVHPAPTDRAFITVMEAQACGRPVIAMRTNSAELTVDPGRTGLLANNPGEFGALMATLAADRDRCDVMGKAGPDYIAKFHSLETRLDQIEEMLLGNRCYENTMKVKAMPIVRGPRE